MTNIKTTENFDEVPTNLVDSVRGHALTDEQFAGYTGGFTRSDIRTLAEDIYSGYTNNTHKRAISWGEGDQAIEVIDTNDPYRKSKEDPFFKDQSKGFDVVGHEGTLSVSTLGNKYCPLSFSPADSAARIDIEQGKDLKNFVPGYYWEKLGEIRDALAAGKTQQAQLRAQKQGSIATRRWFGGKKK